MTRGLWLGVDFGIARLGIARSDPGAVLATPLEVRPSQGLEEDVVYVANLANSLGAVGVVVGLPTRLDGSGSTSTQAAADFVRRLEAVLSLPVVTWDERMTTSQADKALRSGGLTREERARRVDKVAAALILQSYLDRQRERPPDVTPQGLSSEPASPETVSIQAPAASGPPAALPKGSRMPRSKAVAVLAGILTILVICALWLLGPRGGKTEVSFHVPARASAKDVAVALREKYLIRSETAFRLLSRLKGVDNRFRTGVHLLSPSLSTPQIISSLVSGDRRLKDVVVTIPEGYSIPQIAQAMQDGLILRPEEFLAAARRESVEPNTVSFPLPDGSLEGYLFPDTYRFEPDSEPKTVVARMLANFERKAYHPLQSEFLRSSLSFPQVITLASMVEREAKLPQERPLIAGVYLNRLRKMMKLECDATVQYALGRHKARLSYSDLKVDSPYNTYLHPGLPPGPICNPGLDSIRSVLNPIESDFLYYVARPDGSHVFSRTLREHRAAGG